MIDGDLKQTDLVRRYLEKRTCTELIDPVLEALGWTEDLGTREETFIHIRDGRRRRVDYALYVQPQNTDQLVLVALLEAKHEGLPADRGLTQVKNYAAGRRERIRFVFSTNGHHFVQYDRYTKIQSDLCSLDCFPTPDKLVEQLAKSRQCELRWCPSITLMDLINRV